MKASQLKEVLSEIVLKTDITPLIWGIRGIGKSQIVASLIKSLEKSTGRPWGLVDLRISTQEISDLTGIPKTFTWKATNIKTGGKATISETNWSVPCWFPTEEKIAEKDRQIPENGILLLDEINRGGHQETQAIFQFVLDRKIHTHLLAKGWKIIAAANPPTEEYLVNEFDTALLDRFLQLQLKPDASEWINWAKSSEGKIHAHVLSFIDTRPEMLFEMSESEHSWSPPISASPRSWELVSTIMKNCIFSSEVVTEVFAGLIGNLPAISFSEFLTTKYDKPVQGIEIMKDYSEVRERIIKSIMENRIDQINMTIASLIELAKTNPQDFDIDNFYKFLMDIRNDLKVTLVYSLMEIDEIYTKMNNHDDLVQEVTRIMNEIQHTNH